DFGCVVDGYHSDMTRTVALGEPPGPLGDVYDVVRRAQQAGVDAARAGITAGELDRIVRSIVGEAGYGEAFPHPLGPGVGRGMTLDLEGTLFQIIEFQHVKPGKGGAFVRTKLRNVRTGAVIDRTFNAGVNVGLAIVERKEMQYLYRDGNDFVFMDTGTYEQH